MHRLNEVTHRSSVLRSTIAFDNQRGQGISIYGFAQLLVTEEDISISFGGQVKFLGITIEGLAGGVKG